MHESACGLRLPEAAEPITPYCEIVDEAIARHCFVDGIFRKFAQFVAQADRITEKERTEDPRHEFFNALLIRRSDFDAPQDVEGNGYTRVVPIPLEPLKTIPCLLSG